MGTDLAIPDDPSALDLVDPASAMVALVDQARTMLAQANGLEGLADVVEWKARAVTLRVYTQQKDMGHEAELSAAEIVRRAERRIGQLVRDGQAAGKVFRKGQSARRPGEGVVADNMLTTTDAAGVANRCDVSAMFALADGVSDERFEAALCEAKEEGNVSRSNIARKVKPTMARRIEDAAKANPTEPPRNLPIAERADQIRTLAGRNFTSPQIADEIGVTTQRVRELARNLGIEITADAVFGGKFRKVDSNRIISAVIDSAMPEPISLARIAYSELNRDRFDEWVSSLSDAIRSLTTIRRNLQKELTRDQP